MKKLLLLTVMLCMFAMISGCGEQKKSTPATQPLPKKIVIGLDDNFPPMGFRDKDNKLVGFDIDMAKEAGKRLGIEVEFKPIDWSAKEAELTSKRVDMLWNGLTITDKRKEKIAFSKPYMENRQVIIVKGNSPIKTKTDLSGKNIATQDGSTSVDAIEKDQKTLKSFKELKKYGDFVAALMELDNGRVDAVVIDEVVGRYYTAKKPGQYKVLNEHFGSEEYGVGLRKEDTALLQNLQKTLDEMNKDGTSAKISNTWFGSNIMK